MSQSLGTGLELREHRLVNNSSVMSALLSGKVGLIRSASQVALAYRN